MALHDPAVLRMHSIGIAQGDTDDNTMYRDAKSLDTNIIYASTLLADKKCM